jgi:uncharacterized Zn-binding protein involved in type VI secretion
MHTTRFRRSALGALAALVTLAPALESREAQAQFQSTPTLFSGQATAVKGQVLGVPIVLVDTGTVAPEGDTLEAHLLCYPIGPNCALGLPDMTNGALSAEVLNATVVAQGNHSRARASVAELSLNVLGQNVSATLVEARASAECTDGQASVAAASELAHLTINGQTIAVTGEVNQTVPLPLGAGVVVINEQIAAANSGTGDVTVRALHITIPGVVPGTDTDVVIAEAHADIQCGQRFCPQDRDFVTGGGWFDQPRKNFAIAGGIKNGGYWGHLLYIDHGLRIKVKGTGVTAYNVVTGTTVRRIEGTYDIDGQPGGRYEVEVDDRGEPGRDDRFTLSLDGTPAAAGILEGGNIQLHTCK